MDLDLLPAFELELRIMLHLECDYVGFLPATRYVQGNSDNVLVCHLDRRVVVGCLTHLV